MPSSAYHQIGEYVAKGLSVVPECNINASTKEISDKIKTITLEKNEEMISFDVVSLYTNVPVLEAIDVCADLLYAQPLDKQPPIEKDTFIKLAILSSSRVLMSTHDGYYYQNDGLAMGSPPAPLLANGWMSQYDDTIKREAKIYYRYMDDVLRNLKKEDCEAKLGEINNLHKNLKFTMERESQNELPVLDMKVIHNHETGELSSTWFRKSTDTGLVMNYYALSPKRYKRSVVSGFIHRIYRACSNWKHFHESLETAKRILERNQYPPMFYEPILKLELEKLMGVVAEKPLEEKIAQKKIMLKINYRGKCSEDFARALHKINAPCNVVMTLRKLKTVLPSLKPDMDKMFKSGVVYKITCPSCSACYVGQTSRHLTTRFQEHKTKAGPIKTHVASCRTKLTSDDIKILQQTAKGEQFLLTLEALHIREMKPTINTKDEYRARELTIKVL